jgi:alpha-galactosidase
LFSNLIIASVLDIDDCWQAARQYANETIVPDPVRFPSGMKELAADIHALGMKFGVYGDVSVLITRAYWVA